MYSDATQPIQQWQLVDGRSDTSVASVVSFFDVPLFPVLVLYRPTKVQRIPFFYNPYLSSCTFFSRPQSFLCYQPHAVQTHGCFWEQGFDPAEPNRFC